MSDILDTARSSQDEPKLIVRKAPHAAVWSVWTVLEGIPPEEIFEGPTEKEASSWINTGGQAWLEERRRKRNASADARTILCDIVDAVIKGHISPARFPPKENE